MRNVPEEEKNEIQKLRDALQIIADWNQFPDTGEKWPSGNPVSYGANYGSNGERDYMRGIAKKALNIT